MNYTNNNPLQNNRSLRKKEDFEEGFDIKKVIGLILANWYLFVLGICICLFIAFLYIRYTSAVYETDAQLLVNEDQQKSSPSSLSAGGAEFFQDLSGMFNVTNNVNNEVLVLKTRSLMSQVVKSLQLNITYFKKGRVRSLETYEETPFRVNIINTYDTIKPFVLYWNKIDGTNYKLTNKDGADVLKAKYGDAVKYKNCSFIINKNFTREDEGNPNLYYFKVINFDVSVTAFLDNLQVSVPDKDASVINLSISSRIPSKGELVLNNFIKTYIQNSLDQKNEIEDSTINFIDTRLALVVNQLNNIEQDIANYKGKNKLINFDEQSSLIAQSYDTNSKEILNGQVQMDVLNILKSYLEDEKNNQRIIPSNIVVVDPTFQELVSKYNTLMIERDRASLNYVETNPILINIDLQLRNLRKDMINNISILQKNLSLSQRSLENNNGMINNQIVGAQNIEKGYLQLAREQKIKEALYLFLVQKREEVAISRSSNIAQSRMIDQPKAQVNPISPKILIIGFSALILGLLIPSIFLLARNLFNTRIITKEDITKQTLVPIIGELSHNHEDSFLATSLSSRSAIAEQFRSLRTNIQFTFSSGKSKTIMITSSMSSEGKSFISINLANVFALSNSRVVLVELDLRKPKILNYLKLDSNIGLTNYLISDIKVEDIIKPSNINPSLYIVSSGIIPPNPTELLLHEKMRTFFDKLREQFDYIIIDSPPLGLVTDAQIISQYADVSLYIVRQNYTYKKQIEIIQDVYENEKLKNLYLVVNDVKAKGNYGYGYGYSYGYGYGSYAENNKSKS